MFKRLLKILILCGLLMTAFASIAFAEDYRSYNGREEFTSNSNTVVVSEYRDFVDSSASGHYAYVVDYTLHVPLSTDWSNSYVMTGGRLVPSVSILTSGQMAAIYGRSVYTDYPLIINAPSLPVSDIGSRHLFLDSPYQLSFYSAPAYDDSERTVTFSVGFRDDYNGPDFPGLIASYYLGTYYRISATSDVFYNSGNNIVHYGITYDYGYLYARFWNEITFSVVPKSFEGLDIPIFDYDNLHFRNIFEILRSDNSFLSVVSSSFNFILDNFVITYKGQTFNLSFLIFLLPISIGIVAFLAHKFMR